MLKIQFYSENTKWSLDQKPSREKTIFLKKFRKERSLSYEKWVCYKRCPDFFHDRAFDTLQNAQAYLCEDAHCYEEK
jgi:hypothetical protein